MKKDRLLFIKNIINLLVRNNNKIELQWVSVCITYNNNLVKIEKLFTY